MEEAANRIDYGSPEEKEEENYEENSDSNEEENFEENYEENSHSNNESEANNYDSMLIDFSSRFGLSKKLKKPPDPEDMERVLAFLMKSNDLGESEQANTWLEKFTDYFDTHPTIVSSSITRRMAAKSSSQASTNIENKKISNNSVGKPDFYYSPPQIISQHTKKSRRKRNAVATIHEVSMPISNTQSVLIEKTASSTEECNYEDQDYDEKGQRRLSYNDKAVWRKNFEAKLKLEKFKENPTENRFDVLVIETKSF